MFEAICITFAFFIGLAVRQVGLPPLVGFLAAGFVINLSSGYINVPDETGAILDHIAHLGVLMLLFTVGLKLKVKQILQPVVIGGGLLHFIVAVAILSPAIQLITGLDWNTALLLAITLAFSSTVLAAKLLESKRELAAFHGRVAIGILIVQDLIALVVLSVWGGHTPTVWAALIFAMPLLRPVAYRLLDFCGHDELLILAGMLLALVIGGMGFDLVGLSPELGALLMGVLLANHPKAQELSDSLWSVKELFLVGFFLQIGMSGLPDLQALTFALAFALVLPLKGLLFFTLLILFRLRARNAFLSSLSLTTYSEFGLIVAAGVLPEWLVPLALTVALSFIIAAPFNRLAHPLFERLEDMLIRFQLKSVHPDEQPTELGNTSILILGMGRTGTAAYDHLSLRDRALTGLEADPYKVQNHIEQDRNVKYADVEDSNFWHGLDITGLDAVILALNNLEAKLIAARQLRILGFGGPIISHALYDDHVDQIIAAGADRTYLTMYEAGVGLAEHTVESLQQKPT